MGQRSQSARAIEISSREAKKEILQNAAAAGVWFPILQTIGPALLQEARNALNYGEEMVAQWLENYMLAGKQTRKSSRGRLRLISTTLRVTRAMTANRP